MNPVTKKAKLIPYGFFLYLFGLFIDKLKTIVPITYVIIPFNIDSINKVHIEYIQKSLIFKLKY
jgi:hypothetical protein